MRHQINTLVYGKEISFQTKCLFKTLNKYTTSFFVASNQHKRLPDIFEKGLDFLWCVGPEQLMPILNEIGSNQPGLTVLELRQAHKLQIQELGAEQLSNIDVICVEDESLAAEVVQYLETVNIVLPIFKQNNPICGMRDEDLQEIYWTITNPILHNDNTPEILQQGEHNCVVIMFEMKQHNFFTTHANMLSDSNAKLEKYIVVHRASGMGDMLWSLLHAQYLSIMSGRKLLVDWGPSHYRQLDQAKENPFYEMFSLPKPDQTAFLQYKKECKQYYSREDLQYALWGTKPNLDTSREDNLKRVVESKDKYVLYSSSPLFLREMEYTALMNNIELSSASILQAHDFINEIKKYNVVGVHYRHGAGAFDLTHTPEAIEEEFQAYILKITELLEGGADKIFVATDYQPMVERFEAIFPGLVLSLDIWRPHEEWGDPMFSRKYWDQPLDRIQMGNDILQEIWVMAHCNHLVRSRTGSTFNASVYLNKTLRPYNVSYIASKRTASDLYADQKDNNLYYEKMVSAAEIKII